MLGLRLFGLADPWRDRRWSVVVVALLVVSRLAALPSGPWDQDEAYLALGVLDFDPVALAPHPPWFPLWILVGTALRLVAGDPTRALGLAGAFAGGLLLWPLAALWARVLERRLALVAALLVVAAPGPWVLAARGTTETPATVLLVAAAALWLEPVPSGRRLVAGSLLVALSLLVRPQLLPAALVVTAWRARGGRAAATLAPAAALLALGLLGLVVAAGGPEVLVASAGEHLGLHAGGLARNRYGLEAWCLPRALGGAVAGGAFGVLALVGVPALWRHRRAAPAGPVILLTVLTPLALTASFLQNGTLARYGIPLLALAAGAAAAGAAVLVGRRAAVLLGVGAVMLTIQTSLALPAARARPPVVEALARAESIGRPVVVDDRLHAFVMLARRTGGPGAEAMLATPAALGGLADGVRVVRVVELRGTPPSPAAELVHPGHPLLERLAAGRFVRLAVVDQGGPRQLPSAGGPWADAGQTAVDTEDLAGDPALRRVEEPGDR